MFLDPKKPVFFARYHYYAMKILNRPTPWKRWITKLQIIQFATSFALLGKTLWHYQRSDCQGMKALVYNCIFNATLIVQFIGVDKRNKAQKKEWHHHPVMDFFYKKKQFSIGNFRFNSPLFCASKFVAAFSVGAVTAPGNRKKKTPRNRILDLNHKKGGWDAADWIRGLETSPIFSGRFFGCFWLGAGRSREVKWFFKMIRWYPGWVITTMGVGAWCFSLRKPKVAGVWGICESDLELINSV